MLLRWEETSSKQESSGDMLLSEISDSFLFHSLKTTTRREFGSEKDTSRDNGKEEKKALSSPHS